MTIQRKSLSQLILDRQSRMKFLDAELARICRLRLRHFLAIKYGEVIPGAPVLRRIADAFGMRLEQIMKYRPSLTKARRYEIPTSIPLHLSIRESHSLICRLVAERAYRRGFGNPPCCINIQGHGSLDEVITKAIRRTEITTACLLPNNRFQEKEVKVLSRSDSAALIRIYSDKRPQDTRHMMKEFICNLLLFGFSVRILKRDLEPLATFTPGCGGSPEAMCFSQTGNG